jgi:hypothetical protein
VSLNLALVLAGDNSGAKAALSDTRTGVQGLGNDARGTAAVLDQETNSANGAAAASQRLTNVLLGQAAAENNLRSAIERRLGVAANSNQIGDPFAQNAQRAADIEAYGRSLDALRARFNPLFAAEQRHLQELQEINDAVRVGAITEQERAAAIGTATRAYEAQIAILRTMPARGGAANQFAAFNAGQQLQDIAVTAAMGQNPLTIGLQQGLQLGSSLQLSLGDQGATGVINVLRGAVSSLFSPVNLLAVGFTAVAAAAIQFSSAVISRSKSVEEVLKEHKALIDEITKSYPQAAAAAKQYEDQASLLPHSVVGADTTQQIKEETQAYQNALRDFRIQFNLLTQGDTGQGDFARLGKAGAAAFAEISQGIKTGQIDAIELQRRLGELRVDPSLSRDAQDFYNKLQPSVNVAAELERRLQGSSVAARNLAGSFNGPGGLPVYLDPNAGTYARNQLLSEQETQLARLRRSGAADLQAIYAKSPSERAAAARAQAAADVNDNESPEARQLRIQLAGEQALVAAQHQLTDAEEDRKRSLDATLASQQLDLDLIGKTTGQAEAMRLEFQLTQQLREEAARNNVPIDQKELDLIKQKAVEYGKLADEIARAKLSDDLAFSRDQLFRTPQDQAIASQLRSSGLPVDLNGSFANEIRQQSYIGDIHDAIGSFFSTFQQEAISGGVNIGKALLDSLEAALNSAATAVFKQFADQLTSILTQALSKAFGLGGGGSLGGFSFSLAGGGSGLSDFTQVQLQAAAGGLYDVGGWTGLGGKFDPKGIVHANEFVFSSEATRAIGVGNLYRLHEAAKKGSFAEGGYAGHGMNGFGLSSGQNGAAPVVNIYDQRLADNSQAVGVTRSADGKQIDVMIRDVVRDEVNRPSAQANRALRGTYGLKEQVVLR